MLDRLISIGAGAALAAGFAVMAASPALGAGSCSLSAPATVRVGDQVVITGTGFPAATAVDVDLALDGGTPDSFSVQSDSTGGLTITLTPEAADVGATTVTARAGTTCSATAAFTVIGSTGTAPTPAATASAPGAASSAPGAAPRTDAVPAMDSRPGGGISTAWLLALTCLALGLGSVAVGRRRRDR
jgi:hypothetical protein